jgi:hypothetical protein
MEQVFEQELETKEEVVVELTLEELAKVGGGSNAVQLL